MRLWPLMYDSDMGERNACVWPPIGNRLRTHRAAARSDSADEKYQASGRYHLTSIRSTYCAFKDAFSGSNRRACYEEGGKRSHCVAKMTDRETFCKQAGWAVIVQCHICLKSQTR